MKKLVDDSFRNDTRGNILIETALAVPFLVLLFITTFETARYALINQKISRAVSTMGDLLARTDRPDLQVNNIMNALPHIMRPFDTGARSRVITSVITKETGQQTRIVWQASGGGTLADVSRIGAQGDVPVFPDGFALQDNETLVSAEIIYDYRPVLINPFIEEFRLYTHGFYKPRLQNLELLEN